MKSFRSGLPDAPIQAWIPMDLIPSQAEKKPQDLSEFLSVFHSEDPTDASKNDPRSGGAFKGYRAGGAILPWQPGDFGELVAITRQPWKPARATPVVELAPDPVTLAQGQAAEILAKAQEQADQIVANAQNRAEEITLEAHQTGWGIAEAETVTMITTAKEIVKQVSAWREEMLAQSESDVIGLVKAVAEKMFGEGVALDPKSLQETFDRALEDARALGDLRIYVSPEDAANLDPYWREFQISMSGHQVQVIPSEAIRRGGCFINGQLGAVDARVETQLKAIVETLTEEDESGEEQE